MGNSYSYLFEAKGIQRYIMDSGRLADLVGASELIADLCSSDGDDMLTEILVSCNASDLEPSRRAGGSLCLHSDNEDVLNRMRALWRLAIGLRVPGMSFTDNAPVLGANEGAALNAAYAAQPGLRENSAAFLPPTGGPMTEFNPRTGRVATKAIYPGGDRVLLDGVTEPQREHGKDNTGKLAQNFLPKDAAEAAQYIFPHHFETKDATKDNPAFPFGKRNDQTGKPGDARIAVIHADVSGLGQVFRDITRRATKAREVYGVASAIEDAIQAAARAASKDRLLPFSAAKGDKGAELLFGNAPNSWPKDTKLVPARPVVLGGDDITIITRADLALRFTEALLLGIESETQKAFDCMRPKNSNVPPKGLTACAGIAIVSSGHPFLAAQNMAEGMCKHAKKTGKANKDNFRAYLTFAVITSTIDEDFKDDYRKREQKTLDGKYLNGGPYLVSATGENSPTVPNLMALATALKGSAGYGKLIAALGLRHAGAAAPVDIWTRYWQVLEEDTKAFKAIKDALVDNGVKLEKDGLPVLDDALPILNDALELADIGTVIADGHTP